TRRVSSVTSLRFEKGGSFPHLLLVLRIPLRARRGGAHSGAGAHGGTQSASLVVSSRPVPTEASRAQHKSERSRVGCDVVVAVRRMSPRKTLVGRGCARCARGCAPG